MSPLVSSQPVAIPSCDVPERFRLPDGEERVVIKPGKSSCSLCVSSLSFCVERCGAEAVTIEAWFPWDEEVPQTAHCYLTKEAMLALKEE